MRPLSLVHKEGTPVITMAVQPPSIVNKPYRLAEIIKETPDVDTFRFKSADGSKLAFDPGMFVMLTWIGDGTVQKITRAFSVASAPNSDELEFEIHMIHGRLTSKLEEAKVGDMYTVTGPYGQFRFIPKEDKKVLFIAGGTGLAPFMSMLRELRINSYDNDVALLYSVRYPDEIIRKGELEELDASLNLKTTICVTRPTEPRSEGWTGETGHVSPEMIKKHVPDFMDRTAYICGPLGFVKAVQDSLTQINVPKDKVKADVWG